MKKVYFLFFSYFILFNLMSAQPWTESFDTFTSNTYNGSTVDIDGRTWSKNGAGNGGFCNTAMGSYCMTINDDTNGAHLTSPMLSSLKTLSFDYAYRNGDATNVFEIQTSSDGSAFTTIDTHTLGASADENFVNYSIDVNSTTPIYVRILSDDQNAHLFIDDFTVTVNTLSTIDEQTTSKSIKLFVSTTGELKVNGINPTSIQLFDLNGKTVAQVNSATVNVSSLASGVYVALITDSEGNTYTKKFLKK